MGIFDGEADVVTKMDRFGVMCSFGRFLVERGDGETAFEME